MKTNFYKIETDIDKLAQNIVQLLCSHNLSLTTAESCTGGLLSAAVTGVSGASEIFGLGRTVYGNEYKVSELGVCKSTLAEHGAVSEETAVEMAKGAANSAKAAVAISITGIAGPSGGTREKPVGTVYIACSCGEKIKTLHIEADDEQIPKNERRKYIRLESTRQALILALDTVSEYIKE